MLVFLDFFGFACDLHQALGDKFIGSHCAQVLATVGADRNSAVFHIPVTDHQHIGDLLQLCFPDLVAQLLAAAIAFCADTNSVQLSDQFVGVSVGAVGDRQNLDLGGHHPQGKCAGKAFDEVSQRPLVAA